MKNFLLISRVLSVALTALTIAVKCYASDVGAEPQFFGKNFVQSSSSKSSSTYEHKLESVIIRLKIFRATSAETSKAFSDDRLAMFRSIFESKRVDYPGQYSRVIECPEIFKPQFYENENEDYSLKYFFGYANVNKTPGACIPDLVGFRHIYGFLYCKPQNRLIEVDHFSMVDSGDAQSFIGSLTCKN